MKRPIEPKKPIEPKEYIKDFYRIYLDKYNEYLSIEDLKKYLPKNISIDDIRLYYTTEVVDYDEYEEYNTIIIGYMQEKLNKSYKKQLEKYNKDLEKYNIKIEEYNKQIKKYNEYEINLQRKKDHEALERAIKLQQKLIDKLKKSINDDVSK